MDQSKDQNWNRDLDQSQRPTGENEDNQDAETRELKRQLDLGLIKLPPRPSWKTAPYSWGTDEDYNTGLSKQEVQHWREKLIGKRLLSSRGRQGALEDIRYWVGEARKELEQARQRGSQDEIERAQATLDEQLEAERLAPLMPPELDIHYSDMPENWIIAGEGPDAVDRSRITVIIDDSDGPCRYGRGIITDAGRL